jgi:hypothetical protein
VYFLDAALANFDKRVGRVQNIRQQGTVQAVKRQEMPQLAFPGQL